MPDEITAAANEHATRVRDMFAAIAVRYDLLNHLLSGNMDKRWRRLVAKIVTDNLPTENARVLDVACGTGDLSLLLFETSGATVVGSDFCRPMLEIAANKTASLKRSSGLVPFVEADALNLPFADSSFDAATIAFGLRNLSDPVQGLVELKRVTKAGGLIAVLEFSQPVLPGFSFLFRFYFSKLLPHIGGLFSGSRFAYEYLPESVSRFPNQEGLAAIMRRVGLKEVSYRNLTGGIAALHVGIHPR